MQHSIFRISSTFAAAALAEAGEREATALEQAVVDVVQPTPGVELEYVELADAAETIRRIRLDRECFLAVAAQVGATRLIDNVWFDPVAGGFEADRGRLLAEPSILYTSAGEGVD